MLLLNDHLAVITSFIQNCIIGSMFNISDGNCTFDGRIESIQPTKDTSNLNLSRWYSFLGIVDWWTDYRSIRWRGNARCRNGGLMIDDVSVNLYQYNLYHSSWLLDLLADWLLDWLGDWLDDWLLHRLIVWQTNHFAKQRRSSFITYGSSWVQRLCCWYIIYGNVALFIRSAMPLLFLSWRMTTSLYCEAINNGQTQINHRHLFHLHH